MITMMILIVTKDMIMIRCGLILLLTYPACSYDSRTGDPGNPGLWSEPQAFGERAFFRVG